MVRTYCQFDSGRGHHRDSQFGNFLFSIEVEVAIITN